MNLNQVKKLMERKKNSRKGDNGKVLIVGGSEEYVGAVTLAGVAALRAGCDVVTIAALDKVAWTVHKLSPDLVTHNIKGNNLTVKVAKDLVRYAERFDAIL